MSSGVYQINCGSAFYIGSSSNFKRRRHDHMWRLRKGHHPCEVLQAAFNESGRMDFSPIKFIKRTPEDTDDSFRTTLRDAEQISLTENWGNPRLANRSPNAFGPNNSEFMKNRWLDPEFREKMENFLKSRKGAAISEETRRKMSLAKSGANNPKAIPVQVAQYYKTEDGEEGIRYFEYTSATAAAKHYGISQQSFQMWVSGKSEPSISARRGRDNDSNWIRYKFLETHAFRFKGGHWRFFKRGIHGFGVRRRLVP